MAESPAHIMFVLLNINLRGKTFSKAIRNGPSWPRLGGLTCSFFGKMLSLSVSLLAPPLALVVPRHFWL